MTQYFVINGHGSKSHSLFKLGHQHSLLTPETLDVPYTFGINPDFALEPLFKKGYVNPVSDGQWHLYQPNTTIPNVHLAPWQKNEAQNFSKRLLRESHLLSKIDGEKGFLLDRDPASRLMIRSPNGEYITLKGDALKKECELTRQNKSPNRMIAFASPKLSKVKILNPIDLASVLTMLNKEFGPTKSLLATCNASSDSKRVRLQSHKPALPIEQAILNPGPKSVLFNFSALFSGNNKVESTERTLACKTRLSR